MLIVGWSLVALTHVLVDNDSFLRYIFCEWLGVHCDVFI